MAVCFFVNEVLIGYWNCHANERCFPGDDCGCSHAIVRGWATTNSRTKDGMASGSLILSWVERILVRAGFGGHNISYLGAWYFGTSPFNGSGVQPFHKQIADGYEKAAKGKPIRTFFYASLAILAHRCLILLRSYELRIEWYYRKSFDISIPFKVNHADLMGPQILTSSFETLVRVVDSSFQYEPTTWNLICRWWNVLRHGKKYRSPSEFEREMKCVWWRLEYYSGASRCQHIATMQLYTWWVFDRPRRPDPDQDLHDYDDMIYEAYRGGPVPVDYYAKTAIFKKKATELQKRYDDEDQLMLDRLKKLGETI